MKKNSTKMMLFLLASLFISAIGHAQTAYDTIVNRIDSLQAATISLASLNNSVTAYPTLYSNGAWSDLDYDDDSQNFPCIVHIEVRLMNFALAYTTPASNYYGNAGLYQNILKALRFWYGKNPQANDWYYNDVRTPTALGKILCIMRQAPTGTGLPTTLEDSIMNNRMNRAVTSNTNYGSNQQVYNYAYAIRGALQENSGMLSSAVNKIYAIVAFAPAYGQGLQYDYSYLAHGPQQQIATYGGTFENVSYACGVAFAGTRYAMSTATRNLLSGFYKNTYLKTTRGSYFDFQALGRSVVYNYKLGTSNINDINNAKSVDPGNSTAWDAAIARIKGTQPPSYMIAAEHKHFWLADYDLHLRPGYSFNVRTVSNRTFRTERGNGENLLGRYLPDGATTIMRRGDEYYNIAAIWEWDKLPGVTSRNFSTDAGCQITVDWGQAGSTPFVGGVSDSLYGATTYDLNFDGVTAKKSWFYFDNEIVCLGAGISSSQTEAITTALNQSWLKGAVTFSANGSQSTLGTNSSVQPAGLQWVLHDSTGYFFPSGGNANISNMTQTGSWSRVNSNASTSTVTGSVFKLWFNHGATPSNATYAYIVAPGINNAADMDAYNVNNIKIISNTPSIRAVKHNGLNVLEVIFSAAGTIVDSSSHLKITANNPCALLIKNTDSSKITIHAADPSQTLSSLSLSVNFSYAGPTHDVNINLPTGNYKGSSTRVVVDSTDIPVIPVSTNVAVADAFVRDGTYATVNYGTATGLAVKNDGTSYARQAYFKFDLRWLNRPVGGAKLRLYNIGGNVTANTTKWVLFKTTSGSWTESGLTWNNKPAGLTPVDTVNGQVAAGYMEWDVSTVLNSLPADSLLSFQLVSTVVGSTTDGTFASRETPDSTKWPIIIIDSTPSSISPIADAYVQDGGSNTTNYGTGNVLVSKKDASAGYSRQVYLKFDLHGIPLGNLSAARLQLYGSGDVAANTTYEKLYLVPNNSWTETGITWSNMPATSTTLDSAAGVAGSSYYLWDVTNAVANISSDSILSLKIISSTTGSTTGVNFNSRESSIINQRPVILVYRDTTGGAGLMNIVSTAKPTVTSLSAVPGVNVATTGITVYPNPFNDNCTVRSDKTIRKIMVYDAAGKIVQSTANINAYQYLVQMNTLTGGIYFIKIIGDGFSLEKTVVKQK